MNCGVVECAKHLHCIAICVAPSEKVWERSNFVLQRGKREGGGRGRDACRCMNGESSTKHNKVCLETNFEPKLEILQNISKSKQNIPKRHKIKTCCVLEIATFSFHSNFLSLSFAHVSFGCEFLPHRCLFPPTNILSVRRKF